MADPNPLFQKNPRTWTQAEWASIINYLVQQVTNQRISPNTAFVYLKTYNERVAPNLRYGEDTFRQWVDTFNSLSDKGTRAVYQTPMTVSEPGPRDDDVTVSRPSGEEDQGPVIGKLSALPRADVYDVNELRGGIDPALQFQEILREQVPGRANPFAAYLGQQRRPLENLYNLSTAFGDIPNAMNFANYLRQRGGIGRVNPDAFAPFVTRGLQALTYPGNDPGSLPENLIPAYDYLAAPEEASPEGVNTAQERQFQLALLSSFGDVPRAVLPSYLRAARNVFGQYRFANPSENFLPWFAGRGNIFFAPPAR